MADYDIQNTVLGAHGLSGVPPTDAQYRGCVHVRVSRVPVGGATNRQGGSQVLGCNISTSGDGYANMHPPLVADNWADNPATTGTDETRFDDYIYY